MTQSQFADVFKSLVGKCESILLSKSQEYSAGGDKLHNFKIAASLAQCSNEKALAGMMIKHTVSVYDMINDIEDGKTFPLDKWDEKIVDSINYLILLKALLVERAELTDLLF